ncbi:MAG: acetyl-CoA carboxylase biotin carboxylase subunit [Burkholderiaceae bacterium]|nr:acetyl-CoA carboxylase biotin carboxylase subunit [Burkholderiaceae bacterium]
MPVTRVLVANRGEIAVRIIRACQGLGIDTVLAASQADLDSLGARLAGRTVCIGPASANRSYLDARLLVNAALLTRCDALHPGYGFLAESAELSQLCAEHGVTFVGPKPEQIAQMGNKVRARILAAELGLPTLSGSTNVESPDEAVAIARRVGLPMMIKAAAGGGGRGMKIVQDEADMAPMFIAASNEARAAFGDGTLYLERYIADARHVEVQILADRHGNVIHLAERDCSLQRRHQKLLEEAPAPDISESLREQIREAGVALAKGFGYENAGTVEFIVDQDSQTFHFLEMNTRIQVEHPVTEMITGIDLVQEQLRVARGETLRFGQSDVQFRGHAIECRINAEQVERNFRPSPGLITEWEPPAGPNIRLDSHCHAGYRVPIHYDSMIGKLIVYGTDRAEARERMSRALERFKVAGVATTIGLQHFLVNEPRFAAGKVNTRLVEEVLPQLVTA